MLPELFLMASPKDCCFLTCVSQKHTLSTKAGYGVHSSHAKSPSCPRGQNWHHTRGWCFCCGVSPEHPTEHLAVCPGITLTQSLLCENPTIHLPWLKRKGLWSVMLNADKRATETKGKPNSSAFNTLIRNLEMCCLSLWWLQKTLLNFSVELN